MSRVPLFPLVGTNLCVVLAELLVIESGVLGLRGVVTSGSNNEVLNARFPSFSWKPF